MKQLTGNLTKQEILQELESCILELDFLIESTSKSVFFKQIGNKWSIAEQIEHLSTSFIMTAFAFNLPELVLDANFKNKRQQRNTYDEIILAYQLKLSTGSKATFAYRPKISMLRNEAIIRRYWKYSKQLFMQTVILLSEEQLDAYLIPHPIIGKITFREMLYFTSYHLQHHYKSCAEMLA